MSNPVWVPRPLFIALFIGWVMVALVVVTALPAVADHEDVIAERIPLSAETFTLEPVATGFRTPVWGTTAPYSTNQLFIAQSLDGSGDAYTFLDVGPNGADVLVALKTQGFDERGLLGLAFHPHYRKNGLLYTYTSEPLGPEPDFTTLSDSDAREDDSSLSVIREWRVDDPRQGDAVANPASSRVIMRIEQPQNNHNAGALAFGADAMLYIALGDGGGRDGEGVGHSSQGQGSEWRGNSQDLSEGNVLGKILRIDPTGREAPNGQYSIPGDNPFVGGDGPDEAFAIGFRNPFRMSFDHGTGALFAADVGQRDIEEVNIVVAGGNYGWPVKEGTFLFNGNGVANRGRSGDDSPGVPAGMIDPIAQYDHDEGTSVIGGFVYRGDELPQFVGSYIFGDLTSNGDLVAGRFFQVTADGELREIVPTNHDDNRLLITGFGRDTQGELYVMGLQPNSAGTPAGVVYKLVAAS